MRRYTRSLAALIFIVLATAASGQETSAPIRPAPLFNRWQEDWSTLANPATPPASGDDLKYIRLSSDPKTYLSLGFNIRERVELNDAPMLGVGPGPDDHLISRLEAHADLRIAGQVQAFVQLQDDRAPGFEQPRGADVNPLDLEQGFVAFNEKLGGGVIKVRVGRQEMAFDLQRFVSVRDGANARQAYDAAWAEYEVGRWRVIGFFSQPVQNRNQQLFDDYSNEHLTYGGVKLEVKRVGLGDLSLYVSRYTRDNAVFLGGGGQEHRDIVDVRYAGQNGAIDYDIEGMGQWGEVGSRTVRAWATGARAGFTFLHRAWSPRLGLQVDSATGDSNLHDGVIETFNPLFPNGYYLTLAGYTGYVNLIHLKPSVTIHPAKALAITAAGGLQWRETTADGVYTQSRGPVPGTPGRGSAWTGAYGQLRIDWTQNAHVAWALEFVRFQIGGALQQAGAHDSTYLGLENKIAF